MNQLRATRKVSPEDSALTVEQGVLMAVMFLAFALTVEAASPGWWSTMGAVSGTANDYEVANEGQLKQMTQKAVLYLDTNLTGGAGTNLDNMIAGWSNYYATNGYSATNPAPGDYAVINLGQLKYIGGMVYGQLANAGYTGLYPSWIVVNTNSDYVAANIGQMKTVFNFDLSVVPNAQTNLAAASSYGAEIDLTWALPALNNATSITLQQSTNGGSTWTTVATLPPTATSFAATGLDPSQSYKFRVSGSNPVGSSGYTTTSGTFVPIPYSPASISGLLATNGNMNLSWPPSSGATGYDIARQTINGSLTTYYTSASGTYTDTNRNWYTGYRYTVASINAGGTNPSPSSAFPQPQYAIIDLGTNGTPYAINDTNMVASSLSYGVASVWTNGVSTTCPTNFIAVGSGGISTNGQIVGFVGVNASQVYEMTNSSLPTYTNTIIAPATWSPQTGVGLATATVSNGSFLANYGYVPSPANSAWDELWYYSSAISPSGNAAGNCTVNYLGFASNGAPLMVEDQYLAPFKYASGVTPVGTSPNTFVPVAINDTGTMVGAGGYMISGTYTSIGITPFDINNAGLIAGGVLAGPGVSDSGEVYSIATAATTPLGSYHAIKINNASPAQILDGHNGLWNYDSSNSVYRPMSIPDYLPDSGWSAPAATSMNDYGAIVGTATLTTTAGATSHGVMLVPFRAVTDLNGDGTIDDKDAGLQASALSSTASPEDDAKKDGTEYLFPKDAISHGIWSKNDSAAPSGTTDDDNAKPIKITCGATFGSVWFDYSGTNTGTLAFYTSRACTTQVSFPTTTLNGTTTTLYVREEGTVTSEIDGNLVMKLGTADKSKTFCQTQIPLDIVTTLGDAHFFQAANRYILQNNCLHYFTVKNYNSGSVPINIVVRSEDYSTMQPVDAYWNSATGAVRSSILYGMQEVQPAYPNVDQIINGNFSGSTFTGVLFVDRIATTCAGNLITSGALDANVSTSSTSPSAYLEGTDARYLAMSSGHQFTFGTGILPTTSGYQEALGGLGPTGSSDPHYFPSDYNMNLIGEAPVDSKHKALFTLSYQSIGRNAAFGAVSANMISDATSSGCPPMPGGGSGEPTLVWTDGSSSIALALKSPPDTSEAGSSGVAGLPVLGTKHTSSTVLGIPRNPTDGYYITTYLIFDSTKPRP